MWGVSLTHPLLASFLSGEFLLHIPGWRHFYLGSFSYTSLAGHFYLGSFSYTSLAGFIFIWGVSLTHIWLASFLSGVFLLHIPCWLRFYLGSFSYTSHAGFFFLFFFAFFLGSFSYTSRAGFIFIWGVSLKHTMLDLHFFGVFLLHIPCWLLFLIWGVFLTYPVLASFIFHLGSFSYTSSADFIFLSQEFLLHIP